MSNGIMVGWNRAAPGREKQGMELFQDLNTWLGKQQAAKTITSFQPVLLAAHGGDLNGFILISGEPEKLAMMTLTEEWQEFMTRGVLNALGWGVTRAFTGDQVAAAFKRTAKFL